MEILVFILILVTMLIVRKWYLTKVELKSLKADIREANRRLGTACGNSSSPYLNSSDLQRIFGDCLRV